MNVLDTLFQSCLPKDKTPERRPNNFSVNSTQTQAVINAIEREFGIIVDAVYKFPTVIEDKFDDFVQTVVEIPAAIEESFDDFMDTVHEYLIHPSRLIDLVTLVSIRGLLV